MSNPHLPKFAGISPYKRPSRGDHMPKEKQSKLDRLAHQIALDSAQGTIEGCYAGNSFQRPRWFNTQVVSRPEKGDVARAVEYLELRGLLKRRPSNADWVRYLRG